jgi:hypothetical protein
MGGVVRYNGKSFKNGRAFWQTEAKTSSCTKPNFIGCSGRGCIRNVLKFNDLSFPKQ